MNYFHKKIAVVTGASSGIGRALAMGLAKNGCNLAIADIDSDGLQETADMIGRIGVNVILRKLDVTVPDDMRMFAGQVIETFGKTDILVNNAGITTVAMVDEMNRAVFNRVMDVNFWGVFNGISAFLPYMYKQASAQIVNISSSPSAPFQTRKRLRNFLMTIWHSQLPKKPQRPSSVESKHGAHEY